MSQIMVTSSPQPTFSAVVERFFPDAEQLRSQFEARVGPARHADASRFAWDYWHVPDQYTYLRTAARGFFDTAAFHRLVAAVRAWGSEHLGCPNITEPWLSYYVEGCRQEWHTDVAQGLFAFVYSLTRWEARKFKGGETLLMRPEALDYWGHFGQARSRERDGLIERVPARFNQLFVFDGRVPHGVAAVEGENDPLKSRVVVHGWFLPRATVSGGLRMADVEAGIRAARENWRDGLPGDSSLTGTVVVRAKVEPTGTVNSAVAIVTTVVSMTHAHHAAQQANEAAVAILGSLALPAADGPSTLTVPFNTAAT